jgi:hypothetical protein
MVERDSADILLCKAIKGDGFIIFWGILKFKFEIKPISTRKLIKISREFCQIRKIEYTHESFFQALMKQVPDAVYINRAIAIATGTYFVRFVSYLISTLDPVYQSRLYEIVEKNSKADVFFSTIAKTGRLNLLKTAKQEEVSQFGVDSP